MGYARDSVARVGHLYPSGGLCDHEVQTMAPAGLRFLTTRMPFRRTGLEDDRRLVDSVETHAQLLADAQVELIVFNCTAASMLAGPATVRERIHAATGIPGLTTIEAVTEALEVLGARRVLLLNPYPREVEREEVAYLGGLGVEVLASGGPECSSPVEQGLIPPDRWLTEARELAASPAASKADAVLISCAGTPVAAVLSDIERATGLPVVASNQAVVWRTLRALGRPHDLPRYGRLLSARYSGSDPSPASREAPAAQTGGNPTPSLDQSLNESGVRP